MLVYRRVHDRFCMVNQYIGKYTNPMDLFFGYVKHFSMVVFGSRKRWDRWHSPSPNWQEKYHLYTTYIPCLLGGYMLPIPPFRGTSFPTIEFPLEMLKDEGHGIFKIMAYAIIIPIPIGSVGLVYLPTFGLDFCGKCR